MLRPTVRTPKGGFKAPIDVAKLRKAAHASTDRGRKNMIAENRATMKAKGLGKLTGAITSGSSVSKGTTHEDRAWGGVYARSNSPRTLGPLNAYSQTGGTFILPIHGRWLWFPSKRIPRYLVSKFQDPKTGKIKMRRERVTRGNFGNSHLRARIGDLRFVPFRPTLAFLVIDNVTVNAKGGDAKRATGGRLRTRKRRSFIIAFIGIRITYRRQRWSQKAIARREQRKLPSYIRQSLTDQTR